MNSGTTYKEIIQISFPIIMSGFAIHFVQFVDCLFLGRIGEVELAAVGNASIYYVIFFVVGHGFSLGSQIIIGRRNGEKEFSKIGSVFNHSILFLAGLGLLFFIIIQFFTPILFREIIKSHEVYSASIEYVRWRSFGIFFGLINSVFLAFYVGTKNTQILLWTMLLLSVSNIFLDYGFIFGNLGFPRWEVKGAAIASALSELIVTLFLISYTYYTVDIKKYKLLIFKKIELKSILKILDTSGPIMIQSFIAVSAWFIFFSLIEKMGERELAVSQIIKSIYMLLVVPVFGFNAAISTITSNLIGENKTDQVISSLYKTVFIALITNIILVLVLQFYAMTILQLFTHNKETIALSLNVIEIIKVVSFIFIAGFVTFGCVSGTGNTKTSLAIESLTIFIYLTATFFLVQIENVQLQTVWCAEFVYFSFMFIFSAFYLRSGKWKNKMV